MRHREEVFSSLKPGAGTKNFLSSATTAGVHDRDAAERQQNQAISKSGVGGCRKGC